MEVCKAKDQTHVGLLDTSLFFVTFAWLAFNFCISALNSF